MTRLTLAGFAFNPFHAHQDFKTISSGGLTVVCYEPGNDNQSAHPALQHNMFVNKLSQSVAFLPARYGWSVGSVAELEALLDQHAQQIFERLSTFGSCAEVSFFVQLPQVPESRDGKTYLVTRTNWIRSARALKEKLAQVVTELSNAQCGIVDVRFDSMNLTSSSLRIDFAISKTKYDNAVVEAKKTIEKYVIVKRITSPFAPYSFAELGLKTEAAEL